MRERSCVLWCGVICEQARHVSQELLIFDFRLLELLLRPHMSVKFVHRDEQRTGDQALLLPLITGGKECPTLYASVWSAKLERGKRHSRVSGLPFRHRALRDRACLFNRDARRAIGSQMHATMRSCAFQVCIHDKS